MKFSEYIDESVIDKYKKVILSMSNNKVESFLLSYFKKFKKLVKKAGVEKEVVAVINKHLRTNYKSLTDISILGEGMFQDYVEWMKDQLIPAVSIFPTLQIWFEIDKILDGVAIADLNYKKIVIYGLFWIMLVSGQFLSRRWKKSNQSSTEETPKELVEV